MSAIWAYTDIFVAGQSPNCRLFAYIQSSLRKLTHSICQGTSPRCKQKPAASIPWWAPSSEHHHIESLCTCWLSHRAQDQGAGQSGDECHQLHWLYASPQAYSRSANSCRKFGDQVVGVQVWKTGGCKIDSCVLSCDCQGVPSGRLSSRCTSTYVKLHSSQAFNFEEATHGTDDHMPWAVSFHRIVHFHPCITLQKNRELRNACYYQRPI